MKEEKITTELSSPEPKGLLQSKTIWGLLLFILPSLLTRLGADVSALLEGADTLLREIGAILTVLGLRTKSRPLRVPAFLKSLGRSGVVKVLLLGVFAAFTASSLVSCADFTGTVTAGYTDPKTGATVGAEFKKRERPVIEEK